VGNVELDQSYTISSLSGTGASIQLQGALTSTVGDAVINSPIVLGVSTVFEANDEGLLTINGGVGETSGSLFGITKMGNGGLDFAGSAETFTGQLAGEGGIIIDSALLAGQIAIHSGTTYYGSSTIGEIDGTDGAFSAATYDLGTATSAPATLTVTNGLNFVTPSNAASFNFDIGGPSASSQIVVNGGSAQTVELADIQFSGTVVNGYTPGAGDVITLVQNNTGQPISGTFDNLPEGGTVAVGGVNYTISYVGGSNHEDVTLTAPGTATPTNPDIISHTISTSTHGFTVAASVDATDSSTGGTAGLTYTWSVVHAPPGGHAPTFSVNGTNAASTTIPRFFKDGTYILQCLVKDESGNTATADTTVVVGQKARIMKLEPHGATLAKGGHETYIASVLDQFGHIMRTTQTIAFSVPTDDGTIVTTAVATGSDQALFTAGDTAGVYDIKAISGDLEAIAAGRIS
jgi:hypothetical protein